MTSNRSLTLFLTFAALTPLGGCTGAEPAPDTPDAPEPQQIVVRGLDYTYAVQDSVMPGPAVITFENVGKVDHEMAMVRLKEGVTMEEFAEALQQEDGDPGQYLDGTIGILITGPGETSQGRLSVDLQAGRTYLLACNFQDTPEAPHHVDLGMVYPLTVPEPSAAESS